MSTENKNWKKNSAWVFREYFKDSKTIFVFILAWKLKSVGACQNKLKLGSKRKKVTFLKCLFLQKKSVFIFYITYYVQISVRSEH